jgi:tether containing UBX domain for GLUT4
MSEAQPLPIQDTETSAVQTAPNEEPALVGSASVEPPPSAAPAQNEIKVFSAPVASTSAPSASGSTSGPQTPCESVSISLGQSMMLTIVAEVDEAYFEPSLSDVQSYHATVISRSKRLNEAPLLTAKHRDEDRLAREKKKAEKWPTVCLFIFQ